jgi:hypothetical protein
MILTVYSMDTVRVRSCELYYPCLIRDLSTDLKNMYTLMVLAVHVLLDKNKISIMSRTYL